MLSELAGAEGIWQSRSPRSLAGVSPDRAWVPSGLVLKREEVEVSLDLPSMWALDVIILLVSREPLVLSVVEDFCIERAPM